ncbi:MAG: prohibitin family protein [Oscillospiraceae bacterium]|nr:prohibitin family protein [Oscillospiraceae bacterium]
MGEIKFATENSKKPQQFKMSYVWVGTIIFLLLILVFNCFTIVTEGHIGVKYRFERIVSDNLPAGLNFKIPFIEKIDQVNIRNQIYTFEGDAYTSDTQTVNNLRLKVTYRYAPDKMSHLIRTVGISNVENNYLVPNVQKIAKDAIGRVQAEDLVRTRSQVQAKIQEELAEVLLPHGIIVTEFAIENLAFTDAFENAIQAKVIAEQDVERMRHKTEERRVEAEQIRIAADAEAARIRIEAEAEANAIELIQAQIANNPYYIEYLKIINWNGILPQVIGEGVNPFVVLDGTGGMVGPQQPAYIQQNNNNE